MITLQAAMQKGFALTDAEITKLLNVLTKRFPDAIRERDAVRDVESRLHKSGNCSSVSGGAGCPMNAANAYSPEFSRSLQAALLVQRRPIVWPDYSDPKIRSSMFRPPVPMSAETKEKLRAIAPQKDINDEIAKQLRGLSLPEVYTLGAGYLKEKEASLRKKYTHLNPGQQRMVIGNRMRAKYRKEHAK